MPLPGLRPGVVMVGEGEDAELRDLQLGQVVKLGEVASIIVGLLDGTRDAELLLKDAARALGEELNPMGLVELLQALDRRALLDTPRARMVVAQGLVRADIAALQRLARRTRTLESYSHASDDIEADPEIRLAEGSRFSCHSCNRCCSEQHLLGPVTRDERDAILAGFNDLNDDAGSDPSNFIPLPSGDADPQYLLRPRNGHCSYLGDDGLCRVHSVLGVDVKPAVCRLFPFRGVRTPDGWDIGMSMSCPTVGSGKGPDPTEEIRRVLGPLRVLSSQLQQVPNEIPLSPATQTGYSKWKTWETETVSRLQAGDPAEAWLESMGEFLTMQGDGPNDELALDEIDPGETGDDTDFVPAHGMGTAGEDGTDGADELLTALAFWAELLVGLEAADPMALRRFRSGVIRLRAQLGHRPQAAPVLAENARLDNRRADPDRAEPWALRDTDHFRIPKLDGDDDDIAPQADDPDVQRRFMAQALLEKRPLDYGTAGRGLLALTVFLALLRLEPVPGDELQPRLSDLAYLVHHPQLTDILDTRAAARSFESDRQIHAAILGIA